MTHLSAESYPLKLNRTSGWSEQKAKAYWPPPETGKQRTHRGNDSSVECLPCELEDPSLIPRTQVTKSRCLQEPRFRKPTQTGEWNSIQPTTAPVTSLLSVPQSLRSTEALNLRTHSIKNAPAWDGSNVENHRIGGTQ